jgi:hypothetical protein
MLCLSHDKKGENEIFCSFVSKGDAPLLRRGRMICMGEDIGGVVFFVLF